MEYAIKYMKKVGIIAGARSPFVKSGTAFKNTSDLELSITILEALHKKTGIIPDELYFSNVLLNPRYPNFARELILRSSLPKTINAHFVSNNCISGLVAAMTLSERIRSGKIEKGYAGGVENMSSPVLRFTPDAQKFFVALSQAKSLSNKLSVAAQWRPRFALPELPSPKEPSTGLTMGQHCELTAQEFAITRQRQDTLALTSHQRAAAALDMLKTDIIPIAGVEKDTLVRGDTTLEKLSKLKPVFDRSDKGTITAGNASALTDGASLVALASEEFFAAKAETPLAWISDYEYSSIDPKQGLLMAPVFAVQKLLERNKLKFDDIDFFEIHEAFAAQVLATLDAWEKGWQKFPEFKALGSIDSAKINVLGGSLALGHPFAATGGRLLLNAARLLEKKGKGKGKAVISVCAAGAMGCAVLLEK